MKTFLRFAMFAVRPADAQLGDHLAMAQDYCRGARQPLLVNRI